LPPACLVPIDGARVDAASFAGYGIVCPPSIARSVPHRRAEFLHGRRAAACALAALGLAAVEIPIGPTREPVWPPGVIGSISHNHGYAIAVAALRGHHAGVGIDLETVGNSDQQQALLGSVVAPAEAAYLRSLGGAMPMATLLTLVFSAKESLYKGAFHSVGRFFDFSAARVGLVDLDAQRVQLVLQEDLSPEFMRGDLCTVAFELIDPATILTSFAW
jgi:enterobactin synthetase component D